MLKKLKSQVAKLASRIGQKMSSKRNEKQEKKSVKQNDKPESLLGSQNDNMDQLSLLCAVKQTGPLIRELSEEWLQANKANNVKYRVMVANQIKKLSDIDVVMAYVWITGPCPTCMCMNCLMTLSAAKEDFSDVVVQATKKPEIMDISKQVNILYKSTDIKA